MGNTIVERQYRDHAAMRADEITHLIRPDSGTKYPTSPPSGMSNIKSKRGAGFRTLERTDRLLANMKRWGLLPVSADLGPSLLRDKKSGVFFPEVTWQDDGGMSVRHWLRIRPPLHRQDTRPSSVRFVTGTCLFGRSGATMHLADGSQRPLVSNRLSLPSPVKRLSIRDGFSLYELDTACRLSSVIGGMVERDSQTTRIYVHIPRPEYVLVMFGHRRGARGKSVMRDWTEAVERRGARVAAFFETLLATKSTIVIDVGSPLDTTLMPYLRDAVAQGKTPSPRELIQVIHSSGGAVSELLKLWLAARKDNRPVDYYDLAHFGYVAGVAVNLTDDAFTVEVDNPSEEPIFRALSRVIRRADKHVTTWPGNAMAIYPYVETARQTGQLSDGQSLGNVLDGEVSRSIMAQYGFKTLQSNWAA